MNKKLNKIKKKLDGHNIDFLEIDEIKSYFEYRIKDLLSNKKVLVKDELMYLFSETAPSNLRFDPRYLNSLLKNSIYVYPQLNNLPEIRKIVSLKKRVQSYILANYNSNKTQALLLNIIKKYIQKIEIISTYPFVVNGLIRDIPISCMIKNGEWVLPNPELFSFIRECKQNKRFPIIIGKKILGILFPVFKTLSILGLNSYVAYLPEEAKKIVESVTLLKENYFKIKYNNQFIFEEIINDKLEIQKEQNDPISIFFEDIISKYINLYYKNFLSSNIKISNNFTDTISQFPKNTSNIELLKNFKTTQEIVRSLRK